MARCLAYVADLETARGLRSLVVFAEDDADAVMAAIRLVQHPEGPALQGAALVVHREARFDRYADQGEVPPAALLRAGWNVRCHACASPVMPARAGRRRVVVVDRDDVYHATCYRSRAGEERTMAPPDSKAERAS